MFELNGKGAIITGASRGIGREIAKVFHAQGASVAVAARGIEKLQELKEELGERCFVFSCDVSKKDEIEKLVKGAKEAMGQIDILVNNAGITRDGLFMRMSDEDWEKVLRVNLDSAFYLSRAVFRDMLKKREGRIINMASVVGAIGQAGQANYTASKAGLIGLTKALAAEGAERGVTVNAIAPGFIETKMTGELSEEQKQGILSVIPMKKYGHVGDIAAAAVFLASDEAGYITGQTLHVNGGMYRA
jgi:3-oxoacyl-[acyl-carrier protein] reductase